MDNQETNRRENDAAETTQDAAQTKKPGKRKAAALAVALCAVVAIGTIIWYSLGSGGKSGNPPAVSPTPSGSQAESRPTENAGAAAIPSPAVIPSPVAVPSPTAATTTTKLLTAEDAMKIATETAKKQFGEQAFVIPVSEKPDEVEILGKKRNIYQYGADAMNSGSTSMRGIYYVDAETGEVFDNGSGEIKQLR